MKGAKGLSYECVATLGNAPNGATTADWPASKIAANSQTV